jgi:rRNA-processing protein FCF1
MQRTFYLKNKEAYDIWTEGAKAENKSISAFINDCVLEHLGSRKKKRGLQISDLFGK